MCHASALGGSQASITTSSGLLVGRKIPSLDYPPNSRSFARKYSWVGARRMDFVETPHTRTPSTTAQMSAAVNDSSCMVVRSRPTNNSEDWLERRLNYSFRCYQGSYSWDHLQLVAPPA